MLENKFKTWDIVVDWFSIFEVENYIWEDKAWKKYLLFDYEYCIFEARKEIMV